MPAPWMRKVSWSRKLPLATVMAVELTKVTSTPGRYAAMPKSSLPMVTMAPPAAELSKSATRLLMTTLPVPSVVNRLVVVSKISL